MSQLFSYLQQNQFCILVEYLTSQNEMPLKNMLGQYPTVMTLADRVHADDDIAPLEASKNYPDIVDKVLHYSGKGRDIQDFEIFLQHAKDANIQNLLLVTGDKLKKHHNGHGDFPRTRYLESVNAVMAAKQHGGFNIGVAFNPFKYTEAEYDAQYLKLHKKIKAGADFLITQLGFDLEKIKQAQKYMLINHPHFPLIACVMPLTLKRAKFMLKHQVAGITIPEHLLKVLEQEYRSDPVQAEKNVYARCALQILICQYLGYAGVHLSACYKPSEQEQLEQALQFYQTFSLAECEVAWNALWFAETAEVFQPKIITFAKEVSKSQLLKYKAMHSVHNIFFDSYFARGVGRFVFKSSFWNGAIASQFLIKIEHLSKHSLVGCESCGQCRLGDTFYICPETCPKGLANGPCGGTTLDRCEFGDRECIHSIKARLAKAVQQTEQLKSKLIPTVAIETRQSSSWKNWYLASEA